jgi:hypothetical protein
VAGSALHFGTYNHWQGGADGRLEKQAELLAQHEFDLLVSTEGRWDTGDSEGLWIAASRLGMRPLPAPAIRGPNHVVVWVRPGRVKVVRHEFLRWWPHWHAQARVWVEVDGAAFVVVGTHMSPFVANYRRNDCEVTGAQMGKQPCLLAGDLNDSGRGEQADIDWAAAPPWVWRHGPDEQGRTTGDYLARYGFVDVAELAEPNPACRSATAGFHHDMSVPQRRDRILYAGLDAQVLEYEVGEDDGLSDHRLVRARLQLAGGARVASG